MLFVGSIAAFSSAPQIFKIFQTGSVEGIALSTQLIALGSVIAWFIYGVHIKNRPLAITTFITIVILATVVMQIFVYG